MTPREIIKRCIHFQDPPRVGMYFGRFGWDDTVDVFDFFIKDEHGTDPWGITWVVHPDFPTIGIPREHPAERIEEIGKLRAPDPKEFAGRASSRKMIDLRSDAPQMNVRKLVPVSKVTKSANI